MEPLFMDKLTSKKKKGAESIIMSSFFLTLLWDKMNKSREMSIIKALFFLERFTVSGEEAFP